ncbi:MAG: BREX-1 system adenine-specific DNA-methyltransferase PglX [Candidatus Accumulibacter meliphilus]|uniref:BREX-1 system adenine-specific DNA-methyltransferase PglX n=1 Tax=Candidatus Accumulibacter meliphilus TaxID=2211374 RepID=UPI002FC3DCE6
MPEILAHATELVGVLPGLNAARIADLKLAGNKDGELYRLLLVAQCNALSRAMPFLFERIDDESELLLPDNLIRTDSLIVRWSMRSRKTTGRIEIIGWLYQFYISEKKDQVIGKVVASEDIPAATQLFTPNWIVKYMVQNSLGAQWLATYPDSPLKGQMAYYIEPAEQTDEVKAQLAAITPSQLNPEELTLIDPACGSGHILVEAYELFKAIYLERGYRQRDVAQLILEKNLFGLDIDERAAQLTGFALMMKGRADDRRLFERGVKLNVMALVDSAGFDAEGLAKGVELPDYGLKPGDLTELKRLFEHATTFGSLIQVPEGLAEKLPALKQLSEATSQDMFVADALKRLGPLVRQAKLLAAQYDAVVANPPYMGSKGMNSVVKTFTQDHFPDAKQDLFACFIERSYPLAKNSGRNAMVTMQNWMFLSSFQAMRERMLQQKTITTMAQIGYNSFPSMNSKIAQATVFSITNHRPVDFVGTFIDLNSAPQSADKGQIFLARNPEIEFALDSRDFSKLPGSPIAYWASNRVRSIYDESKPLQSFADIGKGLDTGDNESFLRLWFEPGRGPRWVPCLKGGPYRKWYGNHDYVIDWLDDGRVLRDSPGSNLRNAHNYLRPGLTWTRVSSSLPAFRSFGDGFIFESTGPCIFTKSLSQTQLAAFLNSKLTPAFLRLVAPTLDFQSGHISGLPILAINGSSEALQANAARSICATRIDWDAYERSWDFQSFPILTASTTPTPTLESSYTAWITRNRATIAEMKRLEEENNRLFIDAYGLADELAPDVPLAQITLTVNPAYRYGGKLSEDEQWTRFRQDSMEELVSYAIGCMMGRYSLDEPGLIYAHAGNVGFDATRYRTFPADADGIVPVTDELWFEDAAAYRVREFLRATWGVEKLDQNMAFLADNLGAKASEAPGEAIRRYLADKFFKDHCSTYKKRPIYWLFSSGKQGGFQALVYLHRYHEGTLARMRAEYVVPLTGKMVSRIEMLEKDRDAASSTAARNRIAKQIESLKKKHVELLAYDEKLRHYADMRITLDLDDGVKVNYGKFGDLLAEVKVVTGGANDE